MDDSVGPETDREAAAAAKSRANLESSRSEGQCSVGQRRLTAGKLGRARETAEPGWGQGSEAQEPNAGVGGRTAKWLGERGGGLGVANGCVAGPRV